MIILDTSFLFAYYNDNDYFHEDSVKLAPEILSGKYGPVFISDYVFDEFMTIAFNKIKDLDKIVKIGENVLFFTNLIYVDEDVFKDSWEIFKNQKDTKMSFTDCSILALMKYRGISNIATFDEDFLKISKINVVNG